MDAKTQIFKMPNGGVRVQLDFDGAYVELVSRELPKLVIEEATQKLAQHFIDEKKQELLAKIPVESVINQAVAEVVRRIAEVK